MKHCDWPTSLKCKSRLAVAQPHTQKTADTILNWNEPRAFLYRDSGECLLLPQLIADSLCQCRDHELGGSIEVDVFVGQHSVARHTGTRGKTKWWYLCLSGTNLWRWNQQLFMAALFCSKHKCRCSKTNWHCTLHTLTEKEALLHTHQWPHCWSTTNPVCFRHLQQLQSGSTFIMQV